MKILRVSDEMWTVLSESAKQLGCSTPEYCRTLLLHGDYELRKSYSSVYVSAALDPELHKSYSNVYVSAAPLRGEERKEQERKQEKESNKEKELKKEEEKKDSASYEAVAVQEAAPQTDAKAQPSSPQKRKSRRTATPSTDAIQRVVDNAAANPHQDEPFGLVVHFARLWRHIIGGDSIPYPITPGPDLRAAKDIITFAKASGLEPLEIVKRYLNLNDKWVSNQGHPLRLWFIVKSKIAIAQPSAPNDIDFDNVKTGNELIRKLWEAGLWQ